MSRRDRTHVMEDGATAPLKAITLDEFGKRIYTRMVTKGWRQADLARHAGLPRDSVSNYVRGNTRPTSVSLTKLARALGCKEEDLFPNHAISAVMDDAPSFEMKSSPNDPGRALVRMNRLVSLQAAVKIAEILREDAAVNE